MLLPRAKAVLLYNKNATAEIPQNKHAGIPALFLVAAATAGVLMLGWIPEDDDDRMISLVVDDTVGTGANVEIVPDETLSSVSDVD